MLCWWWWFCCGGSGGGGGGCGGDEDEYNIEDIAFRLFRQVLYRAECNITYM